MWVAELFAADCEKTWLHPGEEETMQKWFCWLEKMTKRQEVGRERKSEEEKVEGEILDHCTACAIRRTVDRC